MTLHDEIARLTQEKIAGSPLFLVEVKVSPNKVTVYLDHPKGVGIEDCVAVSRHLQSAFDGTPVFEQHELEVSSPGMDEPLKVLPQYNKRIGRRVNVITFDGLKHTGTLVSADDLGIELDREIARKVNGRKQITHESVRLPFEQIKETRVIFNFDQLR